MKEGAEIGRDVIGDVKGARAPEERADLLEHSTDLLLASARCNRSRQGQSNSLNLKTGSASTVVRPAEPG